MSISMHYSEISKAIDVYTDFLWTVSIYFYFLDGRNIARFDLNRENIKIEKLEIKD